MTTYTFHHKDGRTSVLPHLEGNAEAVHLASIVNDGSLCTNPVVKIVNDDASTSAGGVVWIAPK